MKKEISIGKVKIGGKNKIAIQSMTNTKTCDTLATIKQINALSKAGCDIIRVSVPDQNSAIAIKSIVNEINIPLVADIHFDYKLAIAAVENGAAKIRFNPGNIGNEKKVEYLISFLKERNIPVRIGVNSGSIEKEFLNLSIDEAMFKSAMKHIELVEKFNYDNIVVSVKASDIKNTVSAYRMLHEKCNYPLHLGITEAGVFDDSIIKSSIGIGSLLLDNIGDTIRVSITGDPIKEIEIAKQILFSLGLLEEKRVEIIACPTCARTEIDVENLANIVKNGTKNIKKNIKIAVMGCVVNGIGESKNADFGVAGGKSKSAIIKNGELIKTVNNEDVLSELLKLIDEAK